MTRKFTLDVAVGQTLKLWFGHLPAFLLLTLIVGLGICAPLAGLVVLLGGSLRSVGEALSLDDPAAAVPISSIFFRAIWAYFIEFMRTMIIFLLTAFMAGKILSARSPTPMSTLMSARLALARLVPLAVVTTILGMAVTFGMLACIIPAYLLQSLWLVAAPACCVEGISPTAAFQRSEALTRGHRFKFFLLLIAVGLIEFAIKLGCLLVAVGDSTLGTALNLVNMLVFASLTAVFCCVAYDGLSREKGVGLQGLDEVFA